MESRRTATVLAGWATAAQVVGDQSVITISSLSTEYIQVPVEATVAGNAYNPTSDVVQFAFKLPDAGNPTSGDWHNGSWDTTATGGYLAQCLVGPGVGGVVLAASSPAAYTIWVKITDSPEVPVHNAGLLKIV